MARKKKKKMETPAWIMEGFDSEADYNKTKGVKEKKKGKTFKVRKCPKCGSDEMEVVIGEVGVWGCKKCSWEGKGVDEIEMSEEEFMKHLDKKGETVA